MIVQTRSDAEEALAPAIDTGGVTELTLLIPDAEMAALEDCSRRLGVTTGQMIRRVLREYLAASDDPVTGRSISRNR